MKPNIHPEYRPVLFHDISADSFFLVGSTVKTSKEHTWEDGNSYPYIALDVSSDSHPFYTGQQKQTNAEGRVASFSQRFGKIFSKNKGA
jgi:large subunit ribosomal protein L31